MPADADLERRILEQVAHRNYEPLKLKTLARRLGVPTPQYRKFREVVGRDRKSVV